MATSDAPVTVDHVRLTVRDVAAAADFYERIVGLSRRSAPDGALALGTAERVLIVLHHDPDAPSRPPTAAGLFHTAFLLPSRGDLGAWLDHAARAAVPLTGAADHAVSEALYFSDPEGNGVEIYTDRPRETWTVSGSDIRITNERIDLDALSRDASGPWRGAPPDTVVGHVHLRVGDTRQAETFWRETVGLALAHRYTGASFLGSGGYHHHVAANVWQSSGAGPMPPGAGLAGVALAADGEAFAAIASRASLDADSPTLALEDPWAIPIEVRRA